MGRVYDAKKRFPDPLEISLWQPATVTLPTRLGISNARPPVVPVLYDIDVTNRIFKPAVTNLRFNLEFQ